LDFFKLIQIFYLYIIIYYFFFFFNHYKITIIKIEPLELPDLLASLQKKQGINSLTTLDIQNNSKNLNTTNNENKINTNSDNKDNTGNKEQGKPNTTNNQENKNTNNNTNNTNNTNNNTNNNNNNNVNNNVNNNHNNQKNNVINSSNAYLNGILNELKNEHETNVLTLYTKSLNETLAKLPSIVQGEDHCIPNSPIEYNSDESSELESPMNDEDSEMVDGESEIIKKEINEEESKIKIEETNGTNTTSSIQENEKKIDKMDVEEDSIIGKENVDINTPNNNNSNNSNVNNSSTTINKSATTGESEDNSNNSTTVPQKRPQNPLADRYHNPKKTRKIIIPYETSVSFEESRIFSTIGRSIESFCTPKPIINSKNTEIKSNSHDSHKKNNAKDTKDNKIKVSLSNKITLKLSSHTPYHPPPVPSVNISDLFHDIYTELSINDKKNDDSDSYFQQPSLLTENSMESNLVKKETTIEHIKSMKIDPSKETNTNNDTNDSSLKPTNTNNDTLANNTNPLEGTDDDNKPGINLSELLSLTSNKIFNTILKNEFTAEDSLFGCRRGGDIRIVDELSESVVPAIQQQSEESIENRDKKKDDPNDKNGVNGAPSGINGALGGLGKEDMSSLSKLNSGNAANKIFLHNNHVNIHVHNGGTSSVSNTAHIATFADDNDGHGHSRSRSPAHNRNTGITGYMNSAPSTYHATSVTSSPTGHTKHSGHTITFRNPNSKKEQDTSDTKEDKAKNSINITLFKKKSTVTHENDEVPAESDKVHKKNSTLSAEVVTPTHIKLFKRHSTSATYVNEEEDIKATKEEAEPYDQLELQEHDTMEVFEEKDDIQKENNDNDDDDDIEGEKKLKERSKLPIKLINKLKLGFGKKSEATENGTTVPQKMTKNEHDEKEKETSSTNKPVKKVNTITLKEYKKNSMIREKEKDINDDTINIDKNNKKKEEEEEEEEELTAQFSENGKGLTEEPESMLENEFEEFVEEDEEEFMKSFEKELDKKEPVEDQASLDKKKKMDKLFGEGESSEEEFNDDDMAMEMEMEMAMSKAEDEEEEDRGELDKKKETISLKKTSQPSSPEEEEIEEFNDEFNEIEEEEEENENKNDKVKRGNDEEEPSPPDKTEFEEFNDEFEEFNDDDDDDEEIGFDAMK